MADLLSRLEALLRGYAAASDEARDDGGRLVGQVRRDLRLLVAEFGPIAVDAALDAIPDDGHGPTTIH
jgi:hypothetical protein